MTKRFPAFIGILNASLQTRMKFCEIPVNKLSVNTLRILRDHGFIWGFSYVSPGKRKARLYPRVRIFLKYPILKSVKLYKNTGSNYYLMHTKYLKKALAQNKNFLLTTPFGLRITTPDGSISTSASNNRFSGKILGEIIT